MYLEIITGVIISYTLLFILSLILKDNSIVDIFWGLGFLQITIHSIYLSNTFKIAQIILLIIITLWSFRISLYILSKKLKTKTEDRRYAIWRESWKYFYLRSIFQVYILQAVLLLVVSTAIILFNLNPTPLSNLFLFGITLAFAGLVFETIADIQLKRFISNKKNKGKLMMQGLWKYTRHPNYFGESVFWLGISIATISSSYYALISFITIFILLRFVSGVPMSEKNYLQRPDFKKYAKKTPPFFPNFFIK